MMSKLDKFLLGTKTNTQKWLQTFPLQEQASENNKVNWNKNLRKEAVRKKEVKMKKATSKCPTTQMVNQSTTVLLTKEARWETCLSDCVNNDYYSWFIKEGQYHPSLEVCLDNCIDPILEWELPLKGCEFMLKEGRVSYFILIWYAFSEYPPPYDLNWSSYL